MPNLFDKVHLSTNQRQFLTQQIRTSQKKKQLTLLQIISAANILILGQSSMMQRLHYASQSVRMSISGRDDRWGKQVIVDKNGNRKQKILLLIYNIYSTTMSKVKNIKPKVIEDSEEDSDSSIPIIAIKTKKEKVEEKKVAKKVVKQESSEEEDTPVVEKKPTKNIKAETVVPKKVVPVAKKPVKQESSEQESEEEAPKKVVAKVKSPVQKPVAAKKKVQESSSEQQEEAPKPVAKTAKAVHKVASPLQKAVSPVAKVAKKPAKVESEEESEEEKPVKKTVKSPLQKVKSPLQKALPAKKKVQSSSQESEEQVKPVAKKLAAKVVPKKVKSESEQQSEEQKPAPKKAGKVVKKEVSQQSEQQKPVAKKQAVVAKQAKVVQKKPEPIEEEEQEKPVANDQEGQFEICVRGLSFQAYDSDIRDFFNDCGNVLEVRLLTRDDGKSKGTAFVKFSKKSSFNKAIELNGSEHMGRSLTIEESQGKKPFNNGGSFGGQGGQGGQRGAFGGNKGNYPQGNANIETPTLFIGGLSYNSTAESIKEFFSQAGDVASARVVTDKQTGKPRGFGYIEFHDVDTAKKAYKDLNGGYLDGRAIRLDSAAQRDRPQGGSFGGQGGSYGGQGGSFGGNRGAPRNPGNSTVDLSQDDKNAKKGAIGSFQGKKIQL